jgi:hypothetical protein
MNTLSVADMAATLFLKRDLDGYGKVSSRYNASRRKTII